MSQQTLQDLIMEYESSDPSFEQAIYNFTQADHQVFYKTPHVESYFCPIEQKTKAGHEYINLWLYYRRPFKAVTFNYFAIEVWKWLQAGLKNFTQEDLKDSFKLLVDSFPFGSDEHVNFEISSLSSFSEDIADDKLVANNINIENPHYIQLFKAEKYRVTHVQLIAKLIENKYTQITDCMWVKDQDPTMIVIDDSLRPFGMEYGWSEIQMVEFLLEWFNLGTKHQPKLKKLENTLKV